MFRSIFIMNLDTKKIIKRRNNNRNILEPKITNVVLCEQMQSNNTKGIFEYRSKIRRPVNINIENIIIIDKYYC